MTAQTMPAHMRPVPSQAVADLRAVDLGRLDGTIPNVTTIYTFQDQCPPWAYLRRLWGWVRHRPYRWDPNPYAGRVLFLWQDQWWDDTCDHHHEEEWT